jgi:hypothetical protein
MMIWLYRFGSNTAQGGYGTLCAQEAYKYRVPASLLMVAVELLSCTLFVRPGVTRNFHFSNHVSHNVPVYCLTQCATLPTRWQSNARTYLPRVRTLLERSGYQGARKVRFRGNYQSYFPGRENQRYPVVSIVSCVSSAPVSLSPQASGWLLGSS